MASHDWRTPVEGDAALECAVCGQTLHFRDLSPELADTIREAKPEHWRVAFDAAFHALYPMARMQSPLRPSRPSRRKFPPSE